MGVLCTKPAVKIAACALVLSQLLASSLSSGFVNKRGVVPSRHRIASRSQSTADIFDWGKGASSGNRKPKSVHPRYFQFFPADVDAHQTLVNAIRNYDWGKGFPNERRLDAALQRFKKAAYDSGPRKQGEAHPVVQAVLKECLHCSPGSRSPAEFDFDWSPSFRGYVRDESDAVCECIPDAVFFDADTSQLTGVLELKRDLEMRKWKDEAIVSELQCDVNETNNTAVTKISLPSYRSTVFQTSAYAAWLGVRWVAVTTINKACVLEVDASNTQINVTVHPSMRLRSLTNFAELCMVIHAKNVAHGQCEGAFQRSGGMGRCVVIGFDVDDGSKYFMKMAGDAADKRMLLEEHKLMESVRKVSSQLVPQSRLCEIPSIGVDALVTADCGPTLEVLAEENAQEAQRLLRMTDQCLRRIGFPHPDLEFRNICMDSDGVIRVIDWEPRGAF